MFKKQLYATLLLSSALLSLSTLASADEAPTPTDATAPVVVTPTEPTQPVDVPEKPEEPTYTPVTPEAPVDTTTPVEAPTETPVPAPTDPTTAPSTEEPSQPEVTPEAPKTEEKPDTEPVTEKPVSKPEVSQPTQPTEGQVSPSTGQVVSTVSSEAPVETDTGVSIISTKAGKVILSDGSEVAPEEVGGKTNEDQTITFTKKDGSKVTLPHTGEAKTLGLSLLGTLMALTGALVWKQKKIQDN